MEPPHLVEVDGSHPPNVALILNAPWHLSEEGCEQYIRQSLGAPSTVRVYTDPTCGASLGIFFVEMGNVDELHRLASQTRFLGPHAVSVSLLHLTHGSWDRAGRLPPLPRLHQTHFNKATEGFGKEGFAIRAVQVGLPNTATPEGNAALQEVRRRIANGLAAQKATQ
jgi:hypothetical protein